MFGPCQVAPQWKLKPVGLCLGSSFIFVCVASDPTILHFPSARAPMVESATHSLSLFMGNVRSRRGRSCYTQKSCTQPVGLHFLITTCPASTYYIRELVSSRRQTRPEKLFQISLSARPAGDRALFVGFAFLRFPHSRSTPICNLTYRARGDGHHTVVFYKVEIMLFCRQPV